MINLESVEQIKGIYDNEKIDWDRYTIEICSSLSLKEYSIIVDFLKEEITGECISYGSWFDIKETDCLELLEIILKENKPERDFSHILKKD